MSGNNTAKRCENELILEGIVTTLREDGSTNISPMGPVLDRDFTHLRLRPFATSATYQNLRRHRHGVFHVTDDVDLLVRSALGLEFDPDLQPVPEFAGKYLKGTCRWFAFDVRQIDDAEERVEIECEVVKQGRVRDFLGWNRASHAVLEATILATRLHILPPGEIREELDKLAVVVAKTASNRERLAFQLVREFVDNATSTGAGVDKQHS